MDGVFIYILLPRNLRFSIRFAVFYYDQWRWGYAYQVCFYILSPLCPLFFLVCFSFIPMHSAAQVQDMDALIQEIVADYSGDEDFSDFVAKLLYYRKHPIDLNTADAAQLAGLFFLNPLQIDNLIAHRDKSGSFIDVMELQAVEGLSIKDVTRLLPFVYVPAIFSSIRERLSGDEQLVTSSVMLRWDRTLQEKWGYQITDLARSRYLGSPDRVILRYRLDYKNSFRFSLNMKKDAGEPFFAYQQKYGFDFYSGHLEIKAISKNLKKIVLGDYGLQIGQGLMLWNGFALGKGTFVNGLAKQGQGLVAYTGIDKRNFLRGLAAQFQYEKWEWIPFVAYNKLSGRVEQHNNEWVLRTLHSSGLHRTPTEQRYRKSVPLLSCGSNLRFHKGRFNLEFSAVLNRFKYRKISPEDVAHRYDFRGKNNVLLGAAYRYALKNYYLYGEMALSNLKALSVLNGVLAVVNPNLFWFGSFRYYAPGYYAYYGNALGEGTKVCNEHALMFGIQYQRARKFEWVTYVDIFKFPWWRYRVDGPSAGMDMLTQFTYLWYKRGKLGLRYRYRFNQENHNVTKKDRIIADVNRHQLRLDYQVKLNAIWRIAGRIEGMHYNKAFNAKALGLLVYQDFFWSSAKNKFKINVRLAYFNTDSYYARIYAYEQDIRYAGAFPVYNGRGLRTYLNLHWKMLSSMELWARYAISYFPKQESLGVGLERIDRNIRSDIKVQVRWHI